MVSESGSISALVGIMLLPLIWPFILKAMKLPSDASLQDVMERARTLTLLKGEGEGDQVADDGLNTLVAETQGVELRVDERAEPRARIGRKQPRDDGRADGAGGARDEDHRVRSSAVRATA